MTASELHHLFANTGDPGDSYEGGFDARRAHVLVRSGRGEANVDLHVQVSTAEMSSGSVYAQLSAGEARELAGALERAAAAAERSREIEIEESRDA
jgi:hypothetical protein